MYRFLFNLFSGNKPPKPKKENITGKVKRTHYAKDKKGQPTFLSIYNPKYKQSISIVIWGKDRNNFKIPPEEFYLNKKIKLSERVNYFKNKVSISIRKPEQIVLL